MRDPGQPVDRAEGPEAAGPAHRARPEEHTRPAAGDRVANRGNVLVVLLRAPRPSVGKSRLAATLGVKDTYHVARAFVEDTAELARAGNWRVVAAITPADARPEARGLFPDAEIVTQAEGDLGARITAALGSGLASADRAVLIGSDTPDLPVAILEGAFTALDTADIVLGPARDGGFYLVGVRTIHPALFDGVEWSTSTVCGRTVDNARRVGWKATLLQEWEDVDDAASLDALARRIDVSERARATSAALRAIGFAPEARP